VSQRGSKSSKQRKRRFPEIIKQYILKQGHHRSEGSTVYVSYTVCYVRAFPEQEQFNLVVSHWEQWVHLSSTSARTCIIFRPWSKKQFCCHLQRINAAKFYCHLLNFNDRNFRKDSMSVDMLFNSRVQEIQWLRKWERQEWYPEDQLVV